MPSERSTAGPCPQPTIDPATNRYTAMGTQAITYDAAGNMTSYAGYNYSWTNEEQLSAVCSAGWCSNSNWTLASYQYNALGQPVQRYDGNKGLWYRVAYDAFGNLIGEYDANGASVGYVPLGTRPFALYQNGSSTTTTYFLHPNALGSTELATDPTGSVAQDELFYPWGQEWAVSGKQDERFASLNQRDPASGLDPTPNRFYGSAWGHWLSPDPVAGDILTPQSLNRYAYVLNNPTSLTDPTGLSCTGPDANGVMHCTVDAPAPRNPFLDEFFLRSLFGWGGGFLANPDLLELRLDRPRREPREPTDQPPAAPPPPPSAPKPGPDVLGTLGKVFSGGRLKGQTYVGCVEENINLTTFGLAKSSTKTLAAGLTGLALTAAKSPAGGFSLSEYVAFSGVAAVRYVVPGISLAAALRATELGSQVPAVAGGAALGLFAGSLANCASQRVGQ